MARYSRIAFILACITNLLGSGAQADRRDVLITILHTNDLHGSVMPLECKGGLARIATLIRQIRADMPNVLLLDAGDIIHGTPEDYFSGGRATISAMNATGYNIAVTGNHDYDFGLDTLQCVTSSACFPFLAANVHAASGGQWDSVGQYKVFNVDGIRIGVLGLTTMETVTLHWPGSIKDITVDDPIATAEALVPKVKSESDVLVVLSHLGIDKDYVLAKTVPGIDFIIGSHTHTVLNKLRRVGNTLIAQTGAYGKELGRIDFIVGQDEKGARIASVNGVGGLWNRLRNPPLGKVYPKKALIPVTDNIPEDEAVKQAYLPYRAASDAHLGEVIASAKCAIPGGANESPAADLTADAVRVLVGSDVAVVDAKSISCCGLPAGLICVKSAFDLIIGYTRQSIVVGRVTGQDLFNILSNAVSKNPYGWAISGAMISYKIDKGKPKIIRLMIGSEPIDPARSYTIASQAYVMMGIMSTFPHIEIIAEPRDTTREALISYLRTQKSITPPPIGRISLSVE